MNRGIISNLLRYLGLLYIVDYIRFQIIRVTNRRSNRKFRRNNPNIKLPPDYLIYESFAIEYAAYFEGGRDTAKDLYDLLLKYKSPKDLNILDWGCGPGRIIQHMPHYYDDSCKLYGNDKNPKSIEWCAKNFPNIEFSKNNFSPPLQYKNNFFDILYGISIFTHLSEYMHFAWIKELYRVLSKDGIFLLTTQGQNFKPKLTQKEKLQFDKGQLITRSNVKEGHRTFSAFHPRSFLERLFSDFKVLEHIEKEPLNNYIPQDIWIIKK